MDFSLLAHGIKDSWSNNTGLRSSFGAQEEEVPNFGNWRGLMKVLEFTLLSFQECYSHMITDWIRQG
ncbi:unnamed protein product [Trifolium pratense]|uniref:Uncharacterized protein n=1 Tax=Trifolium pratense TaxID=57577 RepID=A0ACB0LMQ1_TRIPR|nr:unnamed protein product [Trifolium pratense]